MFIQAAEDPGLEAEEELHSRITVLNMQLESLTAKFEEKDRELVAQERQIKEMKNMNAALENQLTEYMDALEHQNKVRIQCTFMCIPDAKVCMTAWVCTAFQ